MITKFYFSLIENDFHFHLPSIKKKNAVDVNRAT